MLEFEIYFSDLKEETQKRLLAELGIGSASEMNWDMDIVPVATVMIEENDYDSENDYEENQERKFIK